MQTTQTRNRGLKSPLEHVLKTFGAKENQNHIRSKSELFSTILGFYEKNGHQTNVNSSI